MLSENENKINSFTKDIVIKICNDFDFQNKQINELKI